MSTPSARRRSSAPPTVAAPERRGAMLEVEVFGEELAAGGPSLATVENLCSLAVAAVGIEDGHLAIEYVDEQRIAQLNNEHRGKPEPTDVLSFPIDGASDHGGVDHGGVDDDAAEHNGADHDGAECDGADHGGDNYRGVDHSAADQDGVERELGDVVICPAHTRDLGEAIVHGVLHLVGFDHETDNGEMLALQEQLLAGERP